MPEQEGSPLDLERLRIDRGGSSAPPARGAGGRRIAVVPLVLVALAAGAAWLFRAPLMARIDRLRLPRVRTALASQESALARSAVSGTAANGYVVAARRAALSADTPGRIVEMRVEEGSVVHAGDVVARLYAEEYAADLRRAQAELDALEETLERARADAELSRADLERLQRAQAERAAEVEDARARRDLARTSLERVAELTRQGFESEQKRDEAAAEVARAEASLEAARARLETARAAVQGGRAAVAAAEAALRAEEARRGVLEAQRDRAAATLEKTEVRAPFDGIVVLKDAEVGEVVSPNSQGGSNARGSVVTMVDFDSLEVQVDVPEENLGRVAVGAPANVYLDARPEVPYAGRVDRIWPTADRQKATVEVRVAFLERDELLRPEMGARVVFDPEEAPESSPSAQAQPAVLIPAAAVVRVEGRRGAFVLERGRVRFRPLELGRQRSGRQIVTSGLAAGERVVLDPPPDLSDGDRVLAEDET